ncbi:ricin-type beta-trefoil lectin domain protein [Marinomonas sp. 2405UD66-6]|uniref:ricin-type beta-trefoil lectin domain protein n=1 Tax=Marinomonas sp. 2405UD66-6 TaxID=3391834 RepID=UPI0039C937E8
MMRQMRFGLIGILILVSGIATAGAPNLQTPNPVIYLADNLDEKDNLGWCIDTLGRGFSENLQTHSCKPTGGDVQFSFEEDTGLIRSVAYPDYCMQYNGGSNPVFGLVTCEASKSTQAFSYNSESMTISPANNAEQCVSVGQASKSAGPFMSRTLELTACAETDPLYRKWVVAHD